MPILSLVQGPTGQIYLLNTGPSNPLNYVLTENQQTQPIVLSQIPHHSTGTAAAEKSNIRVSQATGKLDIDLTKSQKHQQQENKSSTDIVASALVTSKVLKSC